jgi:hypothetical protein
MANSKTYRKHLFRFMIKDYSENRTRFFIELLGLVLGIGATTVMASTMPSPNLFVSYIMWEMSACCLIYGALSRGSVGLTLLYSLYFTIDGIGLFRLIGWL